MTPRGLPDSSDGLEVLRQLSDVRLVAIDIDGTLLNVPTGRVADVVADLNRSLRHYRRGVTLTIATGRAFAGARPVIETLRLTRRTPVILYNGAVVCSADGLTLTRLHVLRAEHLEPVLDLTIAAGLSALIYQPDLPLHLRGDSELPSPVLIERVTGFARSPGPPSEFNGLPIAWTNTEMPDSAAAVVIPTPHGVPDYLLASLEKARGVSVTRSSSAYLEIRPLGANKASALAFISAARGLTSSAVLAIGDSDNDIEMLCWAGCSVAVANSTKGALDASDYRTKGAAAEGVVEALRLLYDARRQRLPS